MRLATRLTILLVVLTTAVAALVGWYTVHTSTRASYAALGPVDQFGHRRRRRDTP